VIFTTNGYEHGIWDDAAYPPARNPGLPQEGRAAAPRRAPAVEESEIDRNTYGLFELQQIAE